MALNHDWIGTEHLLLALLHPDCPGVARRVLTTYGLSLDRVTYDLIESMGDPFARSARGAMCTTAMELVLERANLKALELSDPVPTSEHILLALIDEGTEPNLTSFLERRGIGGAEVRGRVLAVSAEPTREFLLPAVKPAASATTNVQTLDLARTQGGRDPRHRRPWGSAIFQDSTGTACKNGRALRQYFIDRDGNPVLTSDGRPVHVLVDKDGQPVLGDDGMPIHMAVDVPPGSKVLAHPPDQTAVD